MFMSPAVSLQATVPVQQGCIQAEKEACRQKAVGQQNKLAQTIPLVVSRAPQLKQEGDLLSRQTLTIVAILKLLFSPCVGWVLA